MRIGWEIGEKVPVGNTSVKKNGEKQFDPRLGKNQGPVFSQRVVKIYIPS